MLDLKLYVVKQSKNGRLAEHNLKALLDAECQEPYNLCIIDVFENPAAAEADRIMATPTLLRMGPRPQRRLMGNFSDHKVTKLLLEL